MSEISKIADRIYVGITEDGKRETFLNNAGDITAKDVGYDKILEFDTLAEANEYESE